MINTDKEWELWGQKDPYYGVLTDPIFRREKLDIDSKHQFFESGKEHIDYVFDTFKRIFKCELRPSRALDFGSGVGRLTIPLARRSESVVGVDISDSMIREAELNTSEHGLKNIQYLIADDQLSRLEGTFDFIHTFIVMQHIPVERGVGIFQALIDRLESGGYGALHVTYANYWYYDRTGLPPLLTRRQRLKRFSNDLKRRLGLKVDRHKNFTQQDPEMKMYNYLLNQPMYILQRAGVKQVHLDFTAHGGAWGAILFFQK